MPAMTTSEDDTLSTLLPANTLENDFKKVAIVGVSTLYTRDSFDIISPYNGVSEL